MAHESYDLTNLQCKYGSKSWEKPKGSNISESLYERAIGEALKTQNALLGMSYQPTARAESHTLQQGSPTTEMHSEVRLQLTSPDSLSDVQLSASSSDAQHDLLTASLRAHAQRLVLAKVRSEFDHTVLTLLTLNVIYMYYIDHTLMVLLIRVSQLLRLVYFPYSSIAAQRSTGMLLLISNIPIILIHNLIFSSRHETMSEMLFINFIGPEPKSLTKVLTVDVIVMLLQAVLLQCKWDATSFRALSALPVPASDSLEPLTSYLSQRTSDPTPRDDTNVPPVE